MKTFVRVGQSHRVLVFAWTVLAVMLSPLAAGAQQPPPNILVIMGDDIGYWNVSAYNRGQMGYRTPNIDRISSEGAILTDYYGQQSCTAGRAAFITGQSPMRTGLLKVGLPGAKEGLSEKDPTLADLLKPLGYTTGQFGKNRLGDRNEFLPTVHGFDVFFGNLYHLNAEDEPEHPDYPKNLEFKLRFGPRGVLRCTATIAETPGEDARFGTWGKQSCDDTGPLTKKRMETVDEEFLKATLDFIDRAVQEKKPFFAWFNSSRMHIWTRLKPESQGKTGLGLYPDGMVEHDGQVGQLLKKLDDLGIAGNTIVIYTTDNGAETFTWPDGGTTPFRSEKNTNWEGGYRVPALMRWPGMVPPHAEINDIYSAEDWVPTLTAAAGTPDIKEKLLQGYSAGGKSFKVHLDGYDQRDLLAGKGPGKRRESFIGQTTATSPGCATTNIRRCSWSSRRTAWRSGCSPWSRCARPSCLTYVPTRSSVRNRRQATTTNGSSNTCSSWFRRRRSWRSTCNRSRTSRRGRSRAASRSTRPCKC
jgi:arylsulfatase A-like enzyme